MKARRNEPCPCGSGLKHKHCCAGKQAWYQRPTWTAALVGFLLVASLVLAGVIVTRPDDSASGSASGPPGEAPPGKVWSEEHGHWHDAP
jgi:hypothetical protein